MLLQDEKSLRDQELEVRKSDADIEKDNKIVQHKFQAIQEERKNLVEIQDQLDHEYNMIKPLIDNTIFQMEKLR